MTNKSNRKCSYCSQIGHNNVSCEKRKTELQKIEIVNSRDRKHILNLMQEQKICIGSLIEVCTTPYGSPQLSEMFYVKKIVWHSLMMSYLYKKLNVNLKKYLENKGAHTVNYANLSVYSAEMPEGSALTMRLESLQEMKSKKTLFENKRVIPGDFFVHDGGDWEQTISTMPEQFLAGKFYDCNYKIIT